MGGAALWRYVARAMVVARLNKLNTILRTEDQRAGEAGALGQLFSSRVDPASGDRRPLLSSPGTGGIHARTARIVCGSSQHGTIGLGEREKEVIRMKIERLDGAKVIADREHALHGGSGSGGGLVGGGGEK